MLELFRFGVADVGYFNIKCQVDTCQRVIGVNSDVVTDDCSNLGHPRSLRGLCLELHAGLQVHSLGELGALCLDNQVGILFTICFRSRDIGHKLVADGLAGKLIFQSGDDVAMPVEIGEGLSSFTRVKNFTAWRSQCVVHGDDVIIFNLHVRKPRGLLVGNARTFPEK